MNHLQRRSLAWYDLCPTTHQLKNERNRRMLRKGVLFLCGWLMLAGGAVAKSNPRSAPIERKPNIVVIVSDDAGNSDFGFQGGDQIPTPNLDALAADGVRFTQGYVSASVCSPSRAGMITGRYQQRFGHECNLSNEQDGLPTTEQTLAGMLQSTGYQTVALGKWHLGYQPAMHPLHRGFDQYVGMLAGSRSYFSIRDRDPGRFAILRNHAPVDEETIGYVTDYLAGEAAVYIDRHHDDAQPFFMYLCFTAPHTPMQAKKDLFDQFEHIQPKRRRTYAAMMAALDQGVGLVLDRLKAHGLEDNTLVIFINDNGGATNNSSDNGLLRGMKGSKWEGGVRVPWLMRWPAGLPKGQTFDHPAISLDIAPTCLAAARADIKPSQPLDGVNLLPYLLGENQAPPHESLFWRRQVASAVRQGDWKLIRTPGNPTLLFNLAQDLGETQNLAQQHPEVVIQLEQALDQWETQLVEPLWVNGDPWRKNQILKHRMDVIGRKAEQRLP